ncbi:hypothetical protein SASPL_104650 [Salvia splendens]|uniref:Uncharacterized protein n=1 Tax=Salvia splendens TaxID=180675 RepID=A0A8X8YJT5_SALSN|nr:hypothetical protein SASPL_104650 [Salvia splendens]
MTRKERSLEGMSTSMFSSFCAEKLGFSWSSSAVKIDDLKKSKGQGTISSSEAARFAVELDGLHCFETIVPY